MVKPYAGFLPPYMLLDGEIFERLYRGLGRVLRLQVGLQNVDVIVKPLQVLVLVAQPLQPSPTER